MNLVIGARGRLGRALMSRLPGSENVALDRSVYADWTEPEMGEAVADLLADYQGSGHVIYNAAGLTDPKRPLDEHLRVNLVLAQNVIAGALSRGVRVVTFGTIMEEFVGPRGANPYFESKRRLSDHIVSLADKARVLHLRIHTLYGGGAPDRFMFLGLLLHAIQSRETFRMSAGTQLREYHHVDDEIAAIARLVSSGISGAVDISHGEPLRLRDLARYVCEQFGCVDRLEIGAIGAPSSENFDRVFERPAVLQDVVFRDACSGIVEDLKLYCQAN
jgi:nucleoside-diphosphate-sugar epimerase